MAIIFYITFLWHHIRDGSLSRYCRRKIDRRLHKIVMIRVNRALEKDNKARTKQTGRGMRVGTPQGDFKRQPTVPVLDTKGPQDIKPISRQTTLSDLTSLSSHLPPDNSSSDILRREPTVPNVFANAERPNAPSRTATQSSAQSSISYSDNAPLISSAAPLGYRPSNPNAPTRLDSDYTIPSYGPQNRSLTGASQGMQRPFTPSDSRSGPPPRRGTDFNEASRFPRSQSSQARKPMATNTSYDPLRRPLGQPGIDPRPIQEYEMQSHTGGGGNSRPPHLNSNFVAFNPNNQHRGNATMAGPPPGRNFTQPPRPPPMNYFGPNPGPPQRSGTAPIHPTASNNDEVYEAYGGSWQEPRAATLPPRPATAGPGGWNAPRRPLPPRY